ncbi:prolyl aminopeptidase [Aerococcus loyolae]|uniref:prolyl aminopeptidase n=1 Tax=Aerococcus loyolae TaxID=2976809 RepID=UPI0007D9FE68|nr:prolyl aminopeptidase [Aerococcus loyolae]OAM71793.1 prolyl aminopeptidase [Aerococcus loyolae]
MEAGYQNTEVNQSFYLQVDDQHKLYVEDCGNTKGQPVIFLHGGPGSEITPSCRLFFDPEKYHIILFDQRGTGKSKPFLSTKNNTPFDSIRDMELIREYYGYDNWFVFGGSYGSTLALVYAILHPERVEQLILRGIFLGRQEEIEWLYEGGAAKFYPEAYEKYLSLLSDEEQKNCVHAYYQKIHQGDKEAHQAACRYWTKWESSLLTLLPHFPEEDQLSPSEEATAVLESHYFENHMFFEEDNYILNNVHRFNDIPMEIVQGRYDVICPPNSAYQLHQACPKSNLHLVEASGHSPYDPEMLKIIVAIMDQLTE